jgi:CBS domain-containing protein
MGAVRDLPLSPASVPEDASFADAARELSARGMPAIAVLDAAGHVKGVFTQDSLLRGLFPGYLGDLHHTAFVDDDAERLSERARMIRDEPVTRHLTKCPTLEADTSHTHAAELFLHSGQAALPVVRSGRFVGMLAQGALCDVADDLLGR